MSPTRPHTWSSNRTYLALSSESFESAGGEESVLPWRIHMGRECEKTIVFAAHSLPSAASTTITSRAPTELRTLTPKAFVRTVLPSALRVGGAAVLAAAGLSSRPPRPPWTPPRPSWRPPRPSSRPPGRSGEHACCPKEGVEQSAESQQVTSTGGKSLVDFSANVLHILVGVHAVAPKLEIADFLPRWGLVIRFRGCQTLPCDVDSV